MSQMSYVHVPYVHPMEMKFYHEFLDSAAERHPDKEALIMYDMEKTRSCVTYREFKDRSVFLASSLLDHGLSRGHHVLLIGASSIRYAVTIMALRRVGANAILLGPGGLTDDKIELLRTLNLKAIIFDPAMKDSQINQLKRGVQGLVDCRSREETASDVLVFSLADDQSNQRVYEQCRVYESLLVLGKNKGPANVFKMQHNLKPDCLTHAVFTSGSTGNSKLVQHTFHLGMRSFILRHGEINGISEKTYFDRPMSWGWGYWYVLLMAAGSTTVWVPTEMALSEDTNEMVFEIIAEEKCNAGILGVALMRKLILKKFHLKYDLSHFSSFVIGGQRYSRELVQSVFECLPTARAQLVYGSTEITEGMVSFFTIDTTTEQNYGKMGVVPGFEFKIVDEDDKIVQRGHTGEICVRSEFLFLEYLGNPVATKQAKSATGWYYTGDVGRMDLDGMIEVLARTKEFIKRATVKIFPAEIESVLMKHPYVADVVVIGVPDQRLHEEICACVILIDNESDYSKARLSELEAWCAQQWPPGADGLSLKPKYFVVMEGFPLMKTGKVDLNCLRKIAINTHDIKEI